MRICFVVQGRFHVFDLARALLSLGHDVHILTTEPRLRLGQFGVPASRVRALRSWGLLSRLCDRLRIGRSELVVAGLHRWFGRWARRQLLRMPAFEVLHVFSGVAEEVFADPRIAGLKTLLRGSAHIETQAQLLAEEHVRNGGLPIDQPGRWMRAREQREYALADRVVVLSGFARDSFLAHGLAAERLRIVPLGADAARFRCSPAVAEARLERARAGRPLRVLTVGHFSLQKGARDLLAIWQAVVPSGMSCRFVGGAGDAAPLLAQLPPQVEFHGRVPQQQLPAHFDWADLFVFPTIQDGFAAVLVQAISAGLPILCTPNCGGPDLLRMAGAGAVVPIRDPQATVNWLLRLQQEPDLRLQWLAQAARPLPETDWNHAAQAFVAAVAPDGYKPPE